MPQLKSPLWQIEESTRAEGPRMHPDHMKLLRKAQSLNRAGDHPGSARAYQAFLGKEPRHADAWSDLAGHFLALGQVHDAHSACETALEICPGHPAARINLSCSLLRMERLNEAEVLLRSVLQADPRRMDARLSLVECLLHKRDLAQVQRILDEAIRPGAMTGIYASLQPLHAQLWAIFSTELFEAQLLDKAEQACLTAVRLDPKNLTAKSNLGSIHMARGHLGKAEAIFRRLRADHPQDESTHLLLITCLARKGDSAGLDEEVRKILLEHPSSESVHMSVTGTYYNLGRWAMFDAEIDRFRGVSPGSAFLDFEQSLKDLLFGNMPLGWDRYEARLRVAQELRLKERIFAQPAWRGESFVGKTLLLWAEQGLGDALMFIRYIPLVKALGSRVILEIWPALVELSATCEGVDQVVSTQTPHPPFDLQASLVSLPSIFRTELASIPADVPYLDVPDQVPHRQELLEQLAMGRNGTRIGLVWAGSPGHVRDFERSLPATALASLAALSGVTWYSFQLGRKESPPLPNLISLAPYLKNFSDTAYALSGMDLLITVDTAVAHLAGALGIPTLLLLPFQPDFRWLLEREDSPWYPSVRLFRQPVYGDWDSVVQQVISALTQDS